MTQFEAHQAQQEARSAAIVENAALALTGDAPPQYTWLNAVSGDSLAAQGRMYDDIWEAQPAPNRCTECLSPGGVHHKNCPIPTRGFDDHWDEASLEKTHPNQVDRQERDELSMAYANTYAPFHPQPASLNASDWS